MNRTIVVFAALVLAAAVALPGAASAHDIPEGAVISFNLKKCPSEGWKEYTPAYGRFIRGIDRGVIALDPVRDRHPGHTQDDEIKAHSHRTTIMQADNSVDGVDSTTTRSGEHHNVSRETERVGGPETRPKNVALLFCEKV
ncbi:MAG: hypothetical protein OXC15_05980 [Rhodospirillaceae bacterium]|nr:hypothetical protein [Rhodospirillaceae bacterium]